MLPKVKVMNKSPKQMILATAMLVLINVESVYRNSNL